MLAADPFGRNSDLSPTPPPHPAFHSLVWAGNQWKDTVFIFGHPVAITKSSRWDPFVDKRLSQCLSCDCGKFSSVCWKGDGNLSAFAQQWWERELQHASPLGGWCGQWPMPLSRRREHFHRFCISQFSAGLIRARAGRGDLNVLHVVWLYHERSCISYGSSVFCCVTTHVVC
jgi:hypothetical protein